MSDARFLSRLKRSQGGAATLEFALIAPALITMLLGVLMVGIYMQNYNSVRSAAFDAERFTVVEYQRENRMLPPQMEQVALAIASRPPYSLRPEELEACVTTVESGITGAAKYDLELTYKPIEISGIFGFEPPTMSFVQPIIVPGVSVPYQCGADGDGGEGGEGGIGG